MQKFSLVSTVFNEADRLQQSIMDIENQTLLPNEIVIVDAGSTDGTYEQLLDWAARSLIDIKIIQENGCNVAKGRNIAIANASYDLIASTDFGCRFNAKWLFSIISPFNNPEVQVVGGAYGVNEEEITSLAAKANYILTNGYRIVMDEKFLPSSRSIAYYKHVWRKIGGYPENLTLAGDDTWFAKKIREMKIPIFLEKREFVTWGRHQNPIEYMKESFRYGIGDAESRVNTRNFISNIIEITIRYILFIFLIFYLFLIITTKPIPFIWLTLIPVLIFGLRSYSKIVNNWFRLHSKKYDLKVLCYSFILLEMTRIGYVKGYVYGWLRLKNEK